MENAIILLVLLLIICVAVWRALKHFKGGGCCGSAGNTIRSKKTLTAPVMGTKIMLIEGMHCENCEIRVENVLNRIEQVSARVNWKKKQALIAYSAPVEDALLKSTVEKLGYIVSELH